MNAHTSEVEFDGSNPQIWKEPPAGTTGRGAHAEDIDGAVLQGQGVVTRARPHHPGIDYVVQNWDGTESVVSVKSINPADASYRRSPLAVGDRVDEYARSLERWADEFPNGTARVASADHAELILSRPKLQLDVVLPADPWLSDGEISWLNKVMAEHPNVNFKIVVVP